MMARASRVTCRSAALNLSHKLSLPQRHLYPRFDPFCVSIASRKTEIRRAHRPVPPMMCVPPDAWAVAMLY